MPSGLSLQLHIRGPTSGNSAPVHEVQKNKAQDGLQMDTVHLKRYKMRQQEAPVAFDICGLTVTR